MSDPDTLRALARRLQAAFDAGQGDLDADELREARRPVVPQDQWEKAHAWKLSVTIRDAYERGYMVRNGRYRLPGRNVRGGAEEAGCAGGYGRVCRPRR